MTDWRLEVDLAIYWLCGGA